MESNSEGRQSAEKVLTTIESLLSRSVMVLRRGLPATLRQKHAEVRGQRLGAELPHYRGDLTPMVGGMVTRCCIRSIKGICVARKREQFPQSFVCHIVYEFGLFFLHFCAFYLHCGNAGKCAWIEQGVSPLSQIFHEGRGMGRLLPIVKATPLAAHDVDEGVSHRTKAADQIARELLSICCSPTGRTRRAAGCPLYS